ADPDGLRVRGIEGDRADRLHRLLVEDGLERGAAVHRLPDTAARGADVEDGLATVDVRGDGGDAAAHRGGADVARADAGDDAGVDGRRRGLGHLRRLRGQRGRVLRRVQLALRLAGGEVEERVVGRSVGLRGIEREAGVLRLALGAALDRAGDLD